MDGNYLVVNSGNNPAVNYNFMLRVELLYDLPCKSVRAFQKELEFEYLQEGGVNDYVHMLRKPITKPFTIEFERYVGIDYYDPMPLGTELLLPTLLFVSRTPGDFDPLTAVRTYTFSNCVIIKKQFGELSGDRSGLLVETTTMSYQDLSYVTLPWG